MSLHNQFFLVNNAIHPGLLEARGPVLNVEIQVPTALSAVLQAQGKPLPSPLTGFALIDTGASKTCVETPSGSAQQYLYPTTLAFPGTGLPAINFSSVVGSALAAQGIIALIGRDVLSRFLLVYNGAAGMFSLAF